MPNETAVVNNSILSQYDPQRRRSKKNSVSLKSQIGEPVGASNTKIFNASGANIDDTRTLYQANLTDCARGTAVNQRLRDVINCRGFKIRGTFRHTGASSEVLLLNVAVVAAKDPAAAGLITAVNFFRQSGSSTSRGVDFAIALAAIEFHMLPINSDLFTILKHERYQLNAASAGMTDYSKIIDWWIPINRQLTFKGAASSDCNDQIRLVWWCDIMHAAGGSAVSATKLTRQILTTTHFREPQF